MDSSTQESQTPTMHYVPSTSSSAPAGTAEMVQQFWNANIQQMESGDVDFKSHSLPLARIKKVMKSDPEVKQMVSSEAPFIFSKACEIFISELTLRAWMVAEENKRRTLQRSDIAVAVSKSDQYDFLIDIVPREEINYRGKPGKTCSYDVSDLGMPDYISSAGNTPGATVIQAPAPTPPYMSGLAVQVPSLAPPAAPQTMHAPSAIPRPLQHPAPNPSPHPVQHPSHNPSHHYLPYQNQPSNPGYFTSVSQDPLNFQASHARGA